MNKKFEVTQLGDKKASVSVLIPAPDEIPTRPFIGRDLEINRCLAAWAKLGHETPLNFRLSGPPGVGKNELIYHIARNYEKKPLYIMQGHEELTPDDIACTARVTGKNEIEYVGSPLLAAMLKGGICFFDELGKVPSRSMSLLASVLDNRRTIRSNLAGFTIQAHPDFRFCAALNDSDFGGEGLPYYINERTRPAFKLGYPPAAELFEIVKSSLQGVPQLLLDRFREWAVAKLPDQPLSPRAALTVISFAARCHKASQKKLTNAQADKLIEEAAEAVLDVS